MFALNNSLDSCKHKKKRAEDPMTVQKEFHPHPYKAPKTLSSQQGWTSGGALQTPLKLTPKGTLQYRVKQNGFNPKAQPSQH